MKTKEKTRLQQEALHHTGMVHQSCNKFLVLIQMAT